ncbi:inovirus-type Gp2 protein [Thermomonas sp.]|uniref:YagK/YfjJ domain-containing protein n=1 Tax=Thermomonas sp. TaxID=1971895 RepID=UPI0035B1A3C5
MNPINRGVAITPAENISLSSQPLRIVLKQGKLPKAISKAMQLRRASAQALAYSNTIRWTEDEQARMAFTDATTEAWCAARVESVMSKVVRSDKSVILKVKAAGGGERWIWTPLGREFVDLLGPAGGFGSVKQEFAQHAFNPLIDLFWKHAKALPSRNQIVLDIDAKAIKACVAAIRKEASTPMFRKRRSKHLKHVRRNTESLLNYIDELFERWGTLLVIRLDIGYRREFQGPETGAVNLSYTQVREHREKFMDYVRSKAFPGLLRGFAWSLEMGRTSSFHHHMLLFIDGSESRKDVLLARMLGEHWQNVITDKQGRYYNCNADHHDRSGVGMIRHWNSEKLTNLKEVVAPYLTKADYLIRTVVEDGKTFSHGRVPPATTRSGRPRERGTDLGDN